MGLTYGMNSEGGSAAVVSGITGAASQATGLGTTIGSAYPAPPGSESVSHAASSAHGAAASMSGVVIGFGAGEIGKLGAAVQGFIGAVEQTDTASAGTISATDTTV